MSTVPANDPASPEPLIKVRGLVACYGEVEVLKGIDLDVHEGESLAIVGRSGCGKTTLLKHIIALLRPAAGEVWVGEDEITSLNGEELDTVRQQMGVLFQGGALFNSLSVGENVALPLREHTELAEPIIDIMVRIKLALVGLSGFEEYLPAELSGGMKKRAALARAMAMDPRILLCDEPSTGLDPVLAAGIDNLILKLKRAFRMTIVLVSHELASVLTVADRITMLDEGKIIFDGPPDAFKASEDERVAQFVERQPPEEQQDTEAYLRSLIGQEKASVDA